MDGCISDRTFDPVAVKILFLSCLKSQIPVLERYFISDMRSLKGIVFSTCHVTAIESGAFLYLPDLEQLSIASNPLTHIPAGVFNYIPSIRN